MINSGVPGWSWSVDNLDLADELNEEIWSESPDKGSALAASQPLETAGGLQDMNLDGLGGLPWVPDLVGARSGEAGSLLVIGSAYSPFFGDAAGRPAKMALWQYREAHDVATFQRRFVAAVVEPDAAYYGPIGELLTGITTPDRVTLTDLCRASFVCRDAQGQLSGGDTAVRNALQVYHAYVAEAEDWTWTRIEECAGRVIVALGNVATKEVLALFERKGFTPHLRGASAVVPAAARRGLGAGTGIPSLGLGEWCRVARNGQEYRIVAAYHPRYHDVHDPSYAKSRQAITAARSEAAA